jgi:rubrerythrin
MVARDAGDAHMQTVEEFLAHAILLEKEAAERYGELADSMDSAGNREVAKLFRQLSEYSRMHMADATARAGFRQIPDISAGNLGWSDFENAETAAIWAADPMIGREQALDIALEAEMAGHAYYKSVLDTTTDPEIKAMAKEFVLEESEHVAELKKWIAAHKAGKPLPVDR